MEIVPTFENRKNKWFGKGMHVLMASVIISTTWSVSIQTIIAAQEAPLIAAVAAI